MLCSRSKTFPFTLTSTKRQNYIRSNPQNSTKASDCFLLKKIEKEDKQKHNGGMCRENENIMWELSKIEDDFR